VFVLDKKLLRPFFTDGEDEVQPCGTCGEYLYSEITPGSPGKKEGDYFLLSTHRSS
jgi:hypothetical protein